MVNLPKLSINLPQKARILIIRRDNIGDLACTTPAIAVLRAHYPNAEIAALVNSYNAEVLRGNPNLDKVFVYQKLKHAGNLASRFKALNQRLRLIAQLRRWKPDVTILAKASYDRHGLNFARQIGAKNIIGFVPDDLNQAKGLPDVQLKTPEFTAVHEVEAVNQLLAPLGIEDALGPLQVFPDSSVVAALSTRLPTATKRLALHISAREPERRWGNDNFIALAKHILQTQLDTQILLFWSPGKADDPHHPGDDDAAEQLIKAVGSDRLIPMPTQNLTELIAALSLCDLFIGTDGGALHLAVALNKKVVAMFENKPDKLNHWYPWQVKSKVVHSLHAALPDISQISQTQVERALKELVAQ
jgi:ADP-heptose:LPS heptosyltransferase